MKILMIHNYYQGRGGEKVSFELESKLLESKGHTVIPYTRDNWEIAEYGKSSYLNLALDTIWSKKTYQELTHLIQKEKPDIAHFQNTFPLISPSGYYACKENGVPVVQSIRNYRLICPSAIFQRDGQICELCMGKFLPWPGIYYGCYRESRTQTAVVAAMLAYHRLRKTWQEKVDQYIALTDFVRDKMIEGGLPKEKIHVKPNFIYPVRYEPQKEDYCVYVGRLSPEKGIHLLLDAFKEFPDLNLKIVGDGPLLGEVQALLDNQNLQNVELLGKLELEQVMQMIASSRFLVIPTQVYETFGRVVIEAYSCGVPVLASNIGVMREIVEDGKTGILFEPGNMQDLADKALWLWNNPEQVHTMGENARQVFEQKYTPEENYHQLMKIYEIALNRT